MDVILNPLTLSCSRVPLVHDKVNLPPTLLTPAWKRIHWSWWAPNLVIWWVAMPRTRRFETTFQLFELVPWTTSLPLWERPPNSHAKCATRASERGQPTKRLSSASSTDKCKQHQFQSNQEHNSLRVSPTQSKPQPLFDLDTPELLSSDMDSHSPDCFLCYCGKHNLFSFSFYVEIVVENIMKNSEEWQ